MGKVLQQQQQQQHQTVAAAEREVEEMEEEVEAHPPAADWTKPGCPAQRGGAARV